MYIAALLNISIHNSTAIFLLVLNSFEISINRCLMTSQQTCKQQNIAISIPIWTFSFCLAYYLFEMPVQCKVMADLTINEQQQLSVIHSAISLPRSARQREKDHNHWWCESTLFCSFLYCIEHSIQDSNKLSQSDLCSM